MYITLLMESAAGNPNEDEDKFARVYAEDFPAYDEPQIKQLRMLVKAALQDENKCQQYLDLFRAQSLVDRFNFSAGALFTISHKGMNCLDIDQVAETAIETTSDCFTVAEMPEVSQKMEEKKYKIRKQLDDQFASVEREWMDYRTAKDYLIVEVVPYNGNNYQSVSEFQKLVDQYVVTVKLSTKGVLSMSTPVGNLFRWYWGANVKDIWEEAVGNKVKGTAESDAVKFAVVKAAFDQVCEKWTTGLPEKKPIVSQFIASFNSELSNWVGNRANRAFFCVLAFSATTPIDGSENTNGQYMLQSMVNETIYITNGECKIDACFYGDSKALIISYIPYLKYGYYRLVENCVGTTEDELDEYFDSEISSGRILKYYHVEREEFQVSFEQFNDAIQNQG